MTPDIQRLQLLNNLITQTLDVINQKTMMGGLSHTPWTPNVGLSHTPWTPNVPMGTIDPRFVGGYGFSHTPINTPINTPIGFTGFGVDPRFVGTTPFQTLPTWGLTHTPWQMTQPIWGVRTPFGYGW